MKKNIPLEEYDYPLSEAQTAHFPAQPRDSSRLLHRFADGKTTHHFFYDLPNLLRQGDCLFFNDTKVIPARLNFLTETGAAVEIFLLEPYLPFTQVMLVMSACEACSWKCLVGNLKRARGKTLRSAVEIAGKKLIFSAEIVENKTDILVNFTWDNAECRFHEILDAVGNIPLPPYIKRKNTENDKITYQTLYGKNEGAVAAPTAGLHFTESVFEALEKKGIEKAFLTLHVGSGTFMPVKSENALKHIMHKEKVVIYKNILEKILSAKRIIPVGTTSMRSLESLFWYAEMLRKNPDAAFFIPQFYPYENETELGLCEAVKILFEKMQRDNCDFLEGETQIFIFPSYRFRVCEALITNFHQPKSTLLMLVAAMTGENWKEIYQEAANKNYRFLSYGDSSFLESNHQIQR